MTPTPLEASQAELFQRVSSIANSERNLDEMLGEVLGLTVQVTSCDACLVYILENDTNDLVLRASQVPHAQDLGKLTCKIGEGVTGWAAENKSLVALASNAASDPRFKRYAHLIEDTYEALVSVPLMTAGEVVGVINVHHRGPHHHSQRELALLTFVGEQMGNAITRARLAEQVDQLATELETRKLVERAKGILQQRFGMSEEDAWFHLRNESRRTRRSMKELAEAILIVEELHQKRESSK